MRKFLENFKIKTSQFWIETFWQYPDRLVALKISVAVALLIIPFVIIGIPFMGITMSLGAIATVLTETDEYPSGRIKTLSIMLLSFFISSASVELLRPFPILFGIGLLVSTFFFIILGGMGARYRGVTFGALLIAIYTMLGTYMGNPWYYQPILLTLGGLVYGLVSLLLLYIRPWRLLKEQLAIGYRQLGNYTAYKAKFFPSDEKLQDVLRNELAQRNIAVVQSINKSRSALINYNSEVKGNPNISKYYHKWLLLQQLHERAASSHERYDLLSENNNNSKLIEGFGRLLSEISEALDQVADSLLSDIPYKHPIALSWTVTALKDMMTINKSHSQYMSLSLLYKNLSEIETSLSSINDTREIVPMPDIDFESQTIKIRLKKILKKNNPRFRYAVRLCICFLVGYLIMYNFKIEKGEWILLTSLFVCQQTYSETRQRLFERVLGTLIGVVLGVFASKLLPTLTGQIILLIVSIYLFLIWLSKKYSIAVIFITTYVLAAFNIQADLGITVMGPRIVDTLIGAFLAYFVVRYIWPDWQYKHLPDLLCKALLSNKNYLESIYSSHHDSFEYRSSRQATHEADNALTLAWRGIKVEPKKNSAFEKRAFKLTYLNHALLSYLSAIGAHNQKQKLSDAEIDVCKKIQEILDHAINLLTNDTILPNTPLILHELEKWEENIGDQCDMNNNARLTLLRNLIRTTKEMLTETQLLHENRLGYNI